MRRLGFAQITSHGHGPREGLGLAGRLGAFPYGQFLSGLAGSLSGLIAGRYVGGGRRGHRIGLHVQLLAQQNLNRVFGLLQPLFEAREARPLPHELLGALGLERRQRLAAGRRVGLQLDVKGLLCGLEIGVKLLGQSLAHRLRLAPRLATALGIIRKRRDSARIVVLVQRQAALGNRYKADRERNARVLGAFHHAHPFELARPHVEVVAVFGQRVQLIPEGVEQRGDQCKAVS